MFKVVGKGITICFFLRYVNNLKYTVCMNNTVEKLLFWTSQGKVATVYR